MAVSESVFGFLDERFGVATHPDYGTALNGLQVQGRPNITKVAAAVDVSEEVIAAAIEGGADLLIVHHGLFWAGLQPLTGRHFRKVKALLDAGVALWACHLPLDGDEEFGNSALLARALGVQDLEPFAEYKGAAIGRAGSWIGSRADLVARAESVLGDRVQLIAGGPETVGRVAVVTGSGASFLSAAAAGGIDTLVTGEGSHHSYVDAMETGINILYGGHYRTEVFGVRALAEHLADRFDLDWEFLDFPSGL